MNESSWPVSRLTPVPLIYDTLVFIGRFQPFHLGHLAVISEALRQSKRVVIVVGSCFQPRTPQNPFTFDERVAMIRAPFTKEARDRMMFVPVADYPGNDNAWVSSVQAAVDNVTVPNSSVGLIGHSKDSTSYYLRKFPDWKNHIEVPNVDNINATDIRMALLGENEKGIQISKLMPITTYDRMMELIVDNQNKYTKMWANVRAEYAANNKSKQMWANAPYPPTFITTDAVVTQSGYILLIKRGGYPFKGCWALPGGYLEQNKTIEENMLKELDEETRIKIPTKILARLVKGTPVVFDLPNRDPRGRTITHAFHIDLGYPPEPLPKVVGGDDASEAAWFKLSDISRENLAFDHFHIIRHFIPGV